jgi:hypothetical protein
MSHLSNPPHKYSPTLHFESFVLFSNFFAHLHHHLSSAVCTWFQCVKAMETAVVESKHGDRMSRITVDELVDFGLSAEESSQQFVHSF